MLDSTVVPSRRPVPLDRRRTPPDTAYLAWPFRQTSSLVVLDRPPIRVRYDMTSVVRPG